MIVEFFRLLNTPFFRALLGLCLFIGSSALLSTLWGAPWTPTSIRTIIQMLRLAKLQPGEKVVDLGAGDGRIVIVAARCFDAEARGVEIDPLRCLVANMLIWLLGMRRRAHVSHGNMFAFDLSDADVVCLYLMQGTNQRLKKRLLEQLRPGSRVVSRSFSMQDWVPVAIDDANKIFLYEIGKTDSDVSTKFV